ncbi:hypothetical protein [Thalassospira profundimaris]|uniref:Uncharacterized protein n=1 Tax=Thalassospira profundimaris TaxID=502049 RepID=A0A367WVE5_9PROT|nr:hypothetical protein [Thalassospira profundimaris]RCK45433.1 hypothetical protein TH30_12680 [Thalassospira profundimaris]
MSSTLGDLANDYAAAYKADIASFRTETQTEQLCAIATRVAQSCSAVETSSKPVSVAQSEISGAIIIGEATAKKLTKDDAAWIARQAAVSQTDLRKKAEEQQARDLTLLSSLKELSEKLEGTGATDSGYEQSVEGFEDTLASGALVAS